MNDDTKQGQSTLTIASRARFDPSRVTVQTCLFATAASLMYSAGASTQDFFLLALIYGVAMFAAGREDETAKRTINFAALDENSRNALKAAVGVADKAAQDVQLREMKARAILLDTALLVAHGAEGRAQILTDVYAHADHNGLRRFIKEQLISGQETTQTIAIQCAEKIKGATRQ